MTDHQTTRTNYDRLSRWYDILSGSSERPARLRGLQMLDVQLGERLLEIGCGTGESMFMLASRTGPVGSVFGLDLSAGMLQRAKHKLGRHALNNFLLVQGDSFQLPFSNGFFDAIYMSFTLELFPALEIPILLKECKRVLPPTGRMAVVSLSQNEDPGWMERAYQWAHHRWPLVIDCRPISLKEILTGAGFDIFNSSETSIWGLTIGIYLAIKSRT
jgi:ubiquinone/menaquinone biosynthesis C-methylase UbiE